MPEESNIVSWTPANMITVGLIVLTMYVIVGAAVKVWQQRRNGNGG